MDTSHEAPGIYVTLDTSYEEAVERVTAELKKEGFGVLTEIDVRQTLKNKLDVDFRPYVILGACNPPLAYRALQAAPDVGLFLPCNVTVAVQEDGTVMVSIIDPYKMLQFIESDEVDAVAREADTRLRRVASALQVAQP
jgi:uncharacterized protein (DUF302 family)